jgi:hypothetical protein
MRGDGEVCQEIRVIVALALGWVEVARIVDGLGLPLSICLSFRLNGTGSFIIGPTNGLQRLPLRRVVVVHNMKGCPPFSEVVHTGCSSMRAIELNHPITMWDAIVVKQSFGSIQFAWRVATALRPMRSTGSKV